MVTNSNSFQKTLLPKKVTSAAEIIGVVISSTDGSLPNILNYQFILTELNSFKKGIIRQGNYCLTLSPEGIVVGFIDQIQANNEYFENAQTVRALIVRMSIFKIISPVISMNVTLHLFQSWD